MVSVKWFGREVEVSDEEWRACRRMETVAALLGLAIAVGLFVLGFEIGGMIHIAGVVTILTALMYFDGYVARFCAMRKSAKKS